MPQWRVEGSEVIEDLDAPAAPISVEGFDPADYTVEEVKQYVTDHPDQVQNVYDLEVVGKNRSSLVAWLTAD